MIRNATPHAQPMYIIYNIVVVPLELSAMEEKHNNLADNVYTIDTHL